MRQIYTGLSVQQPMYFALQETVREHESHLKCSSPSIFYICGKRLYHRSPVISSAAVKPAVIAPSITGPIK